MCAVHLWEGSIHIVILMDVLVEEGQRQETS